jgi:hypothetical protein
VIVYLTTPRFLDHNRLCMARIKRLGFKIVPVEEAWKPVGDPPDNEFGSTYDPIFRALDEHPDMAVKIISEDSTPLEELSRDERRRIQAGLKGIGNNKTRKIETKVTDSAVYARLKTSD